MHIVQLLSSVIGLTAIRTHARRRDIATLSSVAGTATIDPKAQVSAYNIGLALSDSPRDVRNVTQDSLLLVGFDGCSNMTGVNNAEPQIYSGWQQAQKVMALKAFQEETVDFHSAGALEYLGAASLNSPRQKDMSLIFTNFASLTPVYWPSGYRLHVRCDDPASLCACGTELAYTSNFDNETGLARINFCPAYFTTSTLNSVLNASEKLPVEQKYDMTRYWQTQGHVWTQQLLHIDWVTGATTFEGKYGDNAHVTDLTIQFRTSTGDTQSAVAYGPAMAKLLARWPDNTGDYTIKNADNLALFMISQYVQSQLDGHYPRYPLVEGWKPDQPPDVNSELFLFNSDGSVSLNDTNPLADAFTDNSTTTCIADQDESSSEPMAFLSFAPDSAYPAHYISSLNGWLDLRIVKDAWQTQSTTATAPDAGVTSTSDSTITTPPPLPSFSTYCTLTQENDDNIHEHLTWCSCTDGAQYLTAISSPWCPYLSPGPSSATWGFASVTVTSAPPLPTATQVCDITYKGGWDTFHIYGKYFDPTPLGTDGKGLEGLVKKCALVLHWKFTYLSQDPQGMQWFAQGTTELLSQPRRKCISEAISSAGGSSADACG